MSPFLMGLDCGGRSVRCALVDAHSGRVIAATRPWRPTPAPDAGFFAFDIDTDHCWRLVRESVADAVQKAGARPDDVLGIAVTGMRFSAGGRRPGRRGPFRRAQPRRSRRRRGHPPGGRLGCGLQRARRPLAGAHLPGRAALLAGGERSRHPVPGGLCAQPERLGRSQAHRGAGHRPIPGRRDPAVRPLHRRVGVGPHRAARASATPLPRCGPPARRWGR